MISYSMVFVWFNFMEYGYFLGSFTFLQTALFHSFLGLNSIPSYLYTSSFPIHLPMYIWAVFKRFIFLRSFAEAFLDLPPQRENISIIFLKICSFSAILWRNMLKWTFLFMQSLRIYKMLQLYYHISFSQQPWNIRCSEQRLRET